MGKKYSSSGEVNVAAVNTLISLTNEAILFRFSLYEWMIGSASTAPADVALAWKLARTSVAGTAGGATDAPSPLDGIDIAARVQSHQAPTTEPTSGVELMEIGVNERATFRWVAAPGGELITDGTESDGLSLRVLHASDTDLVQGTVMFEE